MRGPVDKPTGNAGIPYRIDTTSRTDLSPLRRDQEADVTYKQQEDQPLSIMDERALQDIARDSEAYLADVLESTGVPLGPKVERVTDTYAEERIKEKIAHFEPGRPRAGLWSTNEVLKEHGVPPAFRLHLITAVAHLGRIGKDSLEARRGRSGAEDRAW